MTRFFLRPDQIQEGQAVLDAADAHHLHVVLKARAGDAIAVLDGSGREWPGVLDEVGKTRAVARLQAPIQPPNEPRTSITVAQALPKVSEKIEQVLQRGTEIGAAGFWAFTSARSLTHFTGERQHKRLLRWNAIVKTAAEQSGRVRLPSVRADGDLATVHAAAPAFDLALFASEHERQTMLRDALQSSPAPPRSVLVAVGPEGGWTDAEAAAARRAGFVSVSLGPRILRTETAPLVLLSQILFVLE